MSQTDALIEYATILQYRRRTPFPQAEYGEVHHILPRSCGGSNDDANLIRLSPEEHYRVHCLLPYIFPEGPFHISLVYAWNLMTGRGSYSKEQYGDLKRQFAEYTRNLPSKKKGKKCSEATLRRMSEAAKKRWENPDYRRRVIEKQKQRKLTEEQKQKLIEASKGRIPWNKGKHGIFSEEALNKMRQAFSSRIVSEETRQKMSEAHKGKTKSEETRHRMSEASKRRWANPEYIEKFRESNKDYWERLRKK